jgi:hypothetical protein
MRLLTGIGAYKDTRFYLAYLKEWPGDYSPYNVILLANALFAAKALRRSNFGKTEIASIYGGAPSPSPLPPHPPPALNLHILLSFEFQLSVREEKCSKKER